MRCGRSLISNYYSAVVECDPPRSIFPSMSDAMYNWKARLKLCEFSRSGNANGELFETSALDNMKVKSCVLCLLPRRNRGKAYERLLIDMTHADRRHRKEAEAEKEPKKKKTGKSSKKLHRQCQQRKTAVSDSNNMQSSFEKCRKSWIDSFLLVAQPCP